MRSLAWFGILVACAAPGMARADAPLPTTVLRPVRMLDVDPASSLAATIDNGWVTTGATDSDARDSVWVGGLEVSGELALADHVKLFASQPAVYTLAGSDFGGLGNLTLGGALLGAHGPFAGALSFSYSLAGETSGAMGQLLRAEHTRFWTQSDVIHTGVDARWRGTHAVLQLALGFTSLVDEHAGREYLLASRLGLAFPTATGPTFFVEAGLEAPAGDTDGDYARIGRAERADVGLRGRIGGSEQTFALALSGLVVDDVTSLTLAFELRSDFAAIR
jgi:hypothetical protein